MTLQGWSLPLSPDGTASLVPPPPWHFSGDAIGIDYRADPAALSAALPEGMTPTADGDATFVFIDWSSASEHDPRTLADPARGQYREAYVVVPVTYADGRAARGAIHLGRQRPLVRPVATSRASPRSSGR